MDSPKKVFVTGGSGFLGANLVAELNQRNIPVRILCRESSNRAALQWLTYEEVIGDVESEAEVLAEAMQGCDWVFHAAAATQYWRSNKTDWIYKTNVQGTRNMLAAARIANIKKFIFTSSVASLGIPASGVVLTESVQFNLKPKQFIYGHSKYLAEVEVEKAVREGLPVVTLNPTIMIGPRDINQLSGAIILEAWRGRLAVAPPGGINFVAVEDVVQSHFAAAIHGKPGERYLIGGENFNYKEAISIVCDVIGKPASRWTLPRAFVPSLSLLIEIIQRVFGKVLPLDATQLRISAEEIYVDSSKSREAFGIEATPFRVAVERAYQWYREQGIIT